MMKENVREVSLTGRNVVKQNIFTALAITDTTSHIGTYINTQNARDVTLKVTSTLNQIVTLRLIMQGTATVGALKIDVPANASTYLYTVKDLDYLGHPISDTWTILAICSTAPTSGSLNIDAISLPN